MAARAVGMERDEPALLELGPIDDQSVFGNVGEPQSQRLGYPQARRGEQAEQGDISQRADRPSGPSEAAASIRRKISSAE